jgi:hypothetical protein
MRRMRKKRKRRKRRKRLQQRVTAAAPCRRSTWCKSSL